VRYTELCASLFRNHSMSFFSHSERPGPLPIPVQAEVPELQDAELAALYYGQRMGGDFYDFVRVSRCRVVFGLLDVAGRLEDSRSIITATQATFRTAAMDLLSRDGVNENEAMVDLGVQLNRTILKEANGVHPCPAFAACYNEDLGILSYVNSGHLPALLRDKTGITELPATGLPLGLFSHAAPDAAMAALQPGAAILLVSRGVVEGKSRHEEFGMDRVKRSLQESSAESAKEICMNVIDQVKQFMKTPPTHNDVTALSLFRNAAGKAATVSC
jgi:sigma-B regulation protein RsbU (phosphoserine phosphatase)